MFRSSGTAVSACLTCPCAKLAAIGMAYFNVQQILFKHGCTVFGASVQWFAQTTIRNSSLNGQQLGWGLWNYWYPPPIHKGQGAAPEYVNASINLSSPSNPGEPKEVPMREKPASYSAYVCIPPWIHISRALVNNYTYMYKSMVDGLKATVHVHEWN